MNLSTFKPISNPYFYSTKIRRFLVSINYYIIFLSNSYIILIDTLNLLILSYLNSGKFGNISLLDLLIV